MTHFQHQMLSTETQAPDVDFIVDDDDVCRTVARTRRSGVGLAAGAGAIAGAVAAPAAAMAAIAAMGFTEAGIAAGSAAAAMMSAEALLAGGGVAAGGTVATLQSVGVVGLSMAATTGIAACAGALVGAVALGGIMWLIWSCMRPLSLQPGRCYGVKQGMWMVLMEEGWGNVVFYPFQARDEAAAFWDLVQRDRPSRPRIMFEPDGSEVCSGGWNPFALPTIRSRHQGSVSRCGANTLGASCARISGATIALYSPRHRRFLRVMGENVDAMGGVIDSSDDLPPSWDSERLTIVDAGEGEIALHSAAHNRFVRLVGWEVDAKGGTRSVDQLPVEWDSERFTVIDSGDGTIALHSKSHNRFLRMVGGSVDAHGGVRDVDSLPNIWDSERFVVKQLCLPALLCE